MAESNSNSTQLQPPAASASAPPPAPESQIPGPRASRLVQVFDQALARTLRANSYSNFASCFPTPARHVPASLESVWRQLNAKLEEGAKAEFEEIIAEREAVKHINELDQLVAEARIRKENEGESGDGPQLGNAYVFLRSCGGYYTDTDIPIQYRPHTLGAEDLYKAHLTPYLQEAQAILNDKLEATHAQNAELSQTVQAQRLEIEKLLSHLESVVTDVEGAATAAIQFSQEHHIRQDAIQMDEEINPQPTV
ncbi:Nnf1 [Penicillium longicatenatum]|uniref:Nnf1 n=1 Tax=Penicillium longicatenatum TaxID=1561947 RepID=UPI00254764A4|nr:Nnf1 [Penicillium longicatenatum]KAJ5635490.1 Nnf1 [Penicillium longicatenatum]